tara:strand:- start:67 stop:294 length:228 start_codon:yes stop_codon:yes gene_type:complete
MTDEQHKQFLWIASELSPENLTCDGELSKRAVDAKFRRLMAEWHRLQKEVGRAVYEDEIFEREYNRQRHLHSQTA